jgi:hypothetical protein
MEMGRVTLVMTLLFAFLFVRFSRKLSEVRQVETFSYCCGCGIGCVFKPRGSLYSATVGAKELGHFYHDGKAWFEGNHW